MTRKSSRLFFTLSVLLLSLTINGCSWFSDEKTGEEALKTEVTKKSAEQLYTEAKELLGNGRYSKAVQSFKEIDRLYPFSDYAPKSRVMMAYSHYKDEDYDKAIAVIDNFVAINPGNAEVDFMYYLKGISYYDRISDVKRDQKITKNAKKALLEVVRRFPNTSYAKDSKFKIDLINDHLAGKEMEIGRYYLNSKKYIASINRFKEVINDYDDTPQVEEALYRLVETNLILGLSEEAVKYGSILGHNYPNGKWYNKAYKLLGGSSRGSVSIDGDKLEARDLKTIGNKGVSIEDIMKGKIN